MSDTTFRKSSYSQLDCVEAGGCDGRVLVRDSKDSAGAVLELGLEAFAGLVDAVKAGG